MSANKYEIWIPSAGGEDRSTSYNIMEQYDHNTETWTFKQSMQRKRAGAGCCVCDGKIYVAGNQYCTNSYLWTLYNS